MNRRSISHALAACLVLLPMGPAYPGESVLETIVAADRACTADAECTVVMTACCRCTLAAVSRAREKAVRRKIETDLRCNEVCPIACEAPRVVCVEQLCELVTTRDPQAGMPHGAPKGEER